MLRGKAEGGPLDGVELSAPITWHGMVHDRTKKAVLKRYAKGYYVWTWYRDMSCGAWIWKADATPEWYGRLWEYTRE